MSEPTSTELRADLVARLDTNANKWMGADGDPFGGRDNEVEGLLLDEASQVIVADALLIDRLNSEIVAFKAHVANAFPHEWPYDAKFSFGDTAAKKGLAKWRGTVCGWYRPANGKLGYCIESLFEPGSVQIYPETAVEGYEAVALPDEATLLAETALQLAAALAALATIRDRNFTCSLHQHGMAAAELARRTLAGDPI